MQGYRSKAKKYKKENKELKRHLEGAQLQSVRFGEREVHDSRVQAQLQFKEKEIAILRERIDYLQQEAEASMQQCNRELSYFKEQFEQLQFVFEKQSTNTARMLSLVSEKMPVLRQLVPALSVGGHSSKSGRAAKAAVQGELPERGYRQSKILKKTLRELVLGLECLVVKKMQLSIDEGSNVSLTKTVRMGAQNNERASGSRRESLENYGCRKMPATEMCGQLGVS